MKNKFWKWTQNNGERILRIDGVIDDWKLFEDEYIATPKEFREELNSAEGDIVIYLNSPGGNIFSAAEIYTMLKEYSGKVTVRIASYAASAATIIAMAGDSVEVSPLAIMCIHNPWLDYVFGEEKDMIQAAEYLADLKENIINAYAQKTGLPREKISELMDAETYMNAKKAVELHFADKIMFEENQQGEEPEIEPLMYSERRAFNAMMGRLTHSRKYSRKQTQNKVEAAHLYKRLNLIAH